MNIFHAEPEIRGRWLETARSARRADVEKALGADEPGGRDFAAMISPAGGDFIEDMARRALQITRRHFGRTISLYAPLYLSNECVGGCAYCGFALDRDQPRRRLGRTEMSKEFTALKRMGIEDVLLLTGDRCGRDDFEFLRSCVVPAAKRFHNVTVESFAMTEDEYGLLGESGCTGITIYQETYDPVLYRTLHRRGEKRNYEWRLGAPSRALAAGLRTVGVGVLLGLAEPVSDLVELFRHVAWLRREFWQAGILVSFPRICSQFGGYKPAYEVSDSFLARTIFAFRICFPDMPLVLSTREAPEFRDNMAGLGISRMSVASRTTVGGYWRRSKEDKGQFEVGDSRDVGAFCRMLRRKGLEPVFKNWDAAFQPA